MTALDLLTVLCGVVALAAAAVLSVASARLLRAAARLDAARAELEAEAVPAVRELVETVQRAAVEVERVDEVLAMAGAIGERLDAATEATYRVLTTPVIKGQALASGTRRAADRLRRGPRGPRVGR